MNESLDVRILSLKELLVMSSRRLTLLWAVAACLLLSAKTATAASMLSPSSTYYFGFDREKFDGTDLYGLNNSGTTIYDTANAPAARMDFLADPTINGFNVGTEDFESFATPHVLVAGDVNRGNYNEQLNLTFGSTGITGTLQPNGGEVRERLGTGHIAGRYPTSGRKYVDTNQINSSTEMTVTFDDPVAAFGFYATDSGDYDGSLKLIITQVDGGGTTDYHIDLPTPTGDINRNINPNPAPGEPYNASLLFFGLVDVMRPITAVTFINVPDGSYFGGATGPFDDDNYGFDDFIAVTAVPEPGTFGLLLLGGTAIVGYSRRRSRKNDA